MPGGPNGAERAKVAERRAKATSMKLAGATWQRIADELGYDSPGSAFNDVKRFKSQHDAVTAANLDDLRELANARYERLLMSHWPAALQGDEKSSKIVLQILTQQATLNGTNAPKDLNVRLEQRADMEASMVTEAVLAAFDAAGLPPELRMVALEAAQQRLAQMDENVIAGEIMDGRIED